MKRVLVGCLLAVLAAPSFAVIGTVDDVPAATLLLPYFEVDLDNPEGVTTLMSINNASATAVLAHVVLWTDLSVHVLDFNIYLTGYDVQTINLRDIWSNGDLPITASAGQDPGDTISPQGPSSQDINFASCNGMLPYSNPALDASYLDHLRSAYRPLLGHLLRRLRSGSTMATDRPRLCHGRHGELLLAGLPAATSATSVPAAPARRPTRTSSGATTSTSIRRNDFAQGETLVHIEADRVLRRKQLHLLRRRYTLGGTNRRGQPRRPRNNFAVRYVTGGVFDGGTDLLVWRDSRCVRTRSPAAPYRILSRCPRIRSSFSTGREFRGPGGLPDFTLPADSRHHSFSLGDAAHRGRWIQFAGLPGLWLDLPQPQHHDRRKPVPFPPIDQNWVSVTMSAQGRFSVGFDAIQLGNVTDPATAPDFLIPN